MKYRLIKIKANRPKYQGFELWIDTKHPPVYVYSEDGIMYKTLWKTNITREVDGKRIPCYISSHNYESCGKYTNVAPEYDIDAWARLEWEDKHGIEKGSQD